MESNMWKVFSLKSSGIHRSRWKWEVTLWSSISQDHQQELCKALMSHRPQFALNYKCEASSSRVKPRYGTSQYSKFFRSSVECDTLPQPTILLVLVVGFQVPILVKFWRIFAKKNSWSTRSSGVLYRLFSSYRSCSLACIGCKWVFSSSNALWKLSRQSSWPKCKCDL